MTATMESVALAGSAPPYRAAADDVIAGLGSDMSRGLSGAEATSRLARYGRNELATEKAVSGWRRFLSQFQDVLVIHSPCDHPTAAARDRGSTCPPI